MWARNPWCATLAIVVLGAGQALALEGRTIGSVLHTEGLADEDIFRILYELGGRQPMTHDVDLNLRMSVNYYDRFDVSGQELWRSRFHAGLQAPAWRVEGQFAPWQRTAPGNPNWRTRDGVIGVHWTPRRGPYAEAQYQRFDRDVAGILSHSDDRRARVGYALRGVSGDVGYREIDAVSDDALAAKSRTQEWRGTLQGARGFRRGSVQAIYEGLWSRFAVRERQRDLTTHRLGVTGAWAPWRRVTLGAAASERRGHLADNGPFGSSTIDEGSIGGSIEFRPINDLRLQASRDYRSLQARLSNSISDYLQLQAEYRRAVTRGMVFQTGWLRVVNFQAGGEAPNDGVFALLGGRLRQGMEGRAELRAASARGIGVSGIRWQRLLELRTHPSDGTRFEVTWRLDTQPQFFDLEQRDREWTFLAGWDPTPGTSLVAVWRRLDGEGRLQRGERLWTGTGTWSPSEWTQFSVQWSRRDLVYPIPFTVSDVLALDGTFGLPSRWQARALYREVVELSPIETRSFGLSLEKRF